jgi:hypothetical protein
LTKKAKAPSVSVGKETSRTNNGFAAPNILVRQAAEYPKPLRLQFWPRNYPQIAKIDRSFLREEAVFVRLEYEHVREKMGILAKVIQL